MGFVLFVKIIQAAFWGLIEKGRVRVSMPVHKYIYYVQIYKNRYIPQAHTHVYALHAHSVTESLFGYHESNLSVT